MKTALSTMRSNYVAGSVAGTLPCPTLVAARHASGSWNRGAEEWIPGRGLRPPYQVRGRLARNDEVENPLRISCAVYLVHP